MPYWLQIASSCSKLGRSLGVEMIRISRFPPASTGKDRKSWVYHEPAGSCLLVTIVIRYSLVPEPPAQYNSLLLPHCLPSASAARRARSTYLSAAFFCSRRLLFFAFYSWPLGGALFARFILPRPDSHSRPFFVTSIGQPSAEAISPVYSATAGFSFPSASLSHPIGQPSTGGLFARLFRRPDPHSARFLPSHWPALGRPLVASHFLSAAGFVSPNSCFISARRDPGRQRQLSFRTLSG